MELDKIIADLNKEKDRLTSAISALLGMGTTKAKKGKRRGRGISAAPKKKRRGLTAAGRKRLSDLMKKRWAERRKKG